FAVPRTITLTSGELPVTDPVTVAGPGAARLAVSGGGRSRVFDVNGPGVFNVTLAGLTVTGGQTAADRGGALSLQDENVTLSDCVVTGNTAGRDGGAVNVAGGGTLTVRRSTLTNNSSTGAGAAGDGGAINVQGPGTLVIQDSTLSGNTSAHSGGAVYLAPGAA